MRNSLFLIFIFFLVSCVSGKKIIKVGSVEENSQIGFFEFNLSQKNNKVKADFIGYKMVEGFSKEINREIFSRNRIRVELTYRGKDKKKVMFFENPLNTLREVYNEDGSINTREITSESAYFMFRINLSEDLEAIHVFLQDDTGIDQKIYQLKFKK